MAENILTEFNRFFFLGIGGVSMSALAKILKKSGKAVAGCDRCASEYTQELISLGISVEITGSSDIGDYDVIVYTDALPENNPAIIQARRLGKILMPRGRLLHEVSNLFEETVAVAGCHGKTTCTAMIAHVLKSAELPFSSHIGGSDLVLSNAYLGGNRYFVTEACEYRKNFLYIKPAIAVVLNSDADHLDCYGTAQNLTAAYGEFAGAAGEVVKLYGDLDGVSGITFGFDDRADYFAKRIRNLNGKFSFTAYEKGVELGRVALSVYGKHNVLNALAAIAAARRLEIDFAVIADGLKNFKGVRRRFERIGNVNGAQCIADYAHHPNEIRAAIKTARLVTRGELFVVFQPHTYSRTKNFYKQFVLALSPVKRLMIYKTFAAREYYDDAGSALTLSKGVKRSAYGDCETDIERFITCAAEGDTVLFLGAGDIYEIAKTVIDR